MRTSFTRETAKRLLTRGQAIFLAIIALLFVAGLIVAWRPTLIAFIAVVTVFWAVIVGIKVVATIAATQYRFSTNVPSADDASLPTYTVLLPLYKEGDMIPTLVAAVHRLQYPKDRMQALLLLEHDDQETIAAARAATLPSYFEIVVVPPGGPKTKPNAMNVGIAMATGEIVVIYDAEDRPDPLQCLKAVAEFRKGPANLACVQARLRFWNAISSWISAFYGAEYVTHFEQVLIGLSKLGFVVPLGGTSNHFKTDVLRQIALSPDKLPTLEGNVPYIGAWDPYNVTEDAELAGALKANGFAIGMMDSITEEEAPVRAKAACRQRRRWQKGHLHTGLVYLRNPVANARAMGFGNYLVFVSLMLGAPATYLINPLFWATTIIYFVTRSTLIESLFPAPLFYSGVLLMIGGNCFMFFQMMSACLQGRTYGTVKYMYLMPVWWAMTSWVAVRMLIEILNPRTLHTWHKTAHGHNLHLEDTLRPQLEPAQRTTLTVDVPSTASRPLPNES